MRVLAIWPQCDFGWLKKESSRSNPVDAFWVEVSSLEEETRLIRATGPGDDYGLLRGLLRRNAEHPYLYFLVARDRRYVCPMHWTYPFDNLWDAYSPFRAIGPVTITNIRELQSIVYHTGEGEQDA